MKFLCNAILRNSRFVLLALIVLSCEAGEEGAPTKLGEVRESRLWTTCGARFPSSPRCLASNGSLLFPLKKREKT
jgi:hypothetical protein